MAKIHVKVVTGDEFTISFNFFGKSGPLNSRQDAEIQMGFLLTQNLATVNTDQGKTINIQQIVYQWVEG